MNCHPKLLLLYAIIIAVDVLITKALLVVFAPLGIIWGIVTFGSILSMIALNTTPPKKKSTIRK